MPIATLRGVTLDCAGPRALARFYQELTGMRLGYDTDGFAALTDGSGCDLGLQRVDGYRKPAEGIVERPGHRRLKRPAAVGVRQRGGQQPAEGIVGVGGGPAFLIDLSSPLHRRLLLKWTTAPMNGPANEMLIAT